MYAVIRSGGKQKRVSKGDRIRVEKLEAEVGANVTLDQVLLVAGDKAKAKVGQPLVAGAKVTAKVIAQDRDKKIRVFKKQRTTGYQKTKGHRQPYTELEITAIG